MTQTLLATKTSPKTGETVIECRNVWKVFGADHLKPDILDAILDGKISRDQALKEHGAVVAVENANFEVKAGEIFCIMGLSGSGKSTLIRHINRLIEPTSGEIVIEGTPIGGLRPAELRELRAETIGMVFQNMALLPHRTVIENATLALELRGDSAVKKLEAARRTLEIVGLSEWGDRYPSELSGGMQQRVGLARALAADPDILLMDEPFSALDPMIRRQLQDEFKALATTIGKTTLFITHDLDEAIRIGDRIAIMKDGKIVQIGTPQEIVTNPADPYVEDFVEGISRLHLVNAEHIMQPAGSPDALEVLIPDGVSLSDLPKADFKADLAQLFDLYSKDEYPIAVTKGDAVCGLIGVRELIAAVRGKEGDAR